MFEVFIAFLGSLWETFVDDWLLFGRFRKRLPVSSTTPPAPPKRSWFGRLLRGIAIRVAILVGIVFGGIVCLIVVGAFLPRPTTPTSPPGSTTLTPQPAAKPQTPTAKTTPPDKVWVDEHTRDGGKTKVKGHWRKIN